MPAFLCLCLLFFLPPRDAAAGMIPLELLRARGGSSGSDCGGRGKGRLESVTENERINKNDSQAVQEHKKMIVETGRVEGPNGKPAGQ